MEFNLTNIKANILILSPDNVLHQYYCNLDGYPSCLGELLRQKILQSLGLLVLNLNMSLFDCIMETINEFIYSDTNRNGEWKNEGNKNLVDHISIHNDIDYLYIINTSKDFPDLLYYSLATTQIFNKSSNKELINLVNNKCFHINLSTKIKDVDDYGILPF